SVDGALHLDTGRLEGSGTVASDVSGAGTIAPTGFGQLTIDGDYLGTTGAGLELEVAGPSEGDAHDRVLVTGTADLQATALAVDVATADAPNLGSVFDLVSAATVVGPPASASLPPSSFLVVDPATVAIHFATCDPNIF